MAIATVFPTTQHCSFERFTKNLPQLLIVDRNLSKLEKNVPSKHTQQPFSKKVPQVNRVGRENWTQDVGRNEIRRKVEKDRRVAESK
jgi:hypothetical protein